MPDFGPDLVEVFGPSQADGGPELIQLLTPEGERVHHPEFDLDFSAEQLRGFYRDRLRARPRLASQWSISSFVSSSTFANKATARSASARCRSLAFLRIA